MGSVVLDRHGRRVVRSRTHAAQREGPGGPAHPPHARHQRGERLPVRCDVRPAGRPGAGTCSTGGRRRRSPTGRFPDVGHSMHGERPELYVETLLDWVEGLDRVRPAGLIDVHAHYLPAFYREALLQHGHAQPDGFPHIPDWSAEEHVAAMDRLGIARSLLSISSPGVHLGDEVEHPRPRTGRQRGGAARRRRSSRPLRALRLASAAGRRCRDGRDRALRRAPRRHRVRAAHERRRHLSGRRRPSHRSSVSSTDARHGSSSTRRHRPVGSRHRSGRPRPMIEFLFDTTRAVVDMVLNGIVANPPGDRVRHPPRRGDAADDRRSGQRLLHAARGRSQPSTSSATWVGSTSTWPGIPLPRQLDALLTLTTIDHLHYGSDYPFTPEFAADASLERLAEVGGPDGPLLEALRANTHRLFPDLA